MKSPNGYRQVLIALFILMLAQFACSVGGTSSTTSPQLAPSSESQTTQPPSVATSPHGTADEAQSMLQKAVAHYSTVGRQQALSDFNGRVTPFFDRDLYVACIDANLVISANGGFPNLVGSKTEPLSRATWDSASTNHIGSIDYSYTDPATGKSEPKTFYFEKVGTDVCGVGVYH